MSIRDDKERWEKSYVVEHTVGGHVSGTEFKVIHERELHNYVQKSSAKFYKLIPVEVNLVIKDDGEERVLDNERKY